MVWGLAAELKIPRLSVGWEGGGYFESNLVSGLEPNLEEGGQFDRPAVPEQAVWGGGRGGGIPHCLAIRALKIPRLSVREGCM